MEKSDLQEAGESSRDIVMTIAPTDLVRSYLSEAAPDADAVMPLIEKGKLQIDLERTKGQSKITVDLLCGEEIVFSLQWIGETI